VAAAPHAVVDAPLQVLADVAFSSQSFSIVLLLLAGTALAFAIALPVCHGTNRRPSKTLELLREGANARVTTRRGIATLIASRWSERWSQLGCFHCPKSVKDPEFE
jgi:hypothetical protein